MKSGTNPISRTGKEKQMLWCRWQDRRSVGGSGNTGAREIEAVRKETWLASAGLDFFE
jgi:hypothetical protein